MRAEEKLRLKLKGGEGKYLEWEQGDPRRDGIWRGKEPSGGRVRREVYQRYPKLGDSEVGMGVEDSH